jgi:flagellar assembly factor FliW
MKKGRLTADGGTMNVTFQSTRFGEVEIPEEAVIEFPRGLIGLGGSRYTLLAREQDAAFVWLHSLDDPALALPLTNPWAFFPSFEVEIADEDAELIGVRPDDDTSVYVTVRAGEALSDFSANLRAPILVKNGLGHQVINTTPDAPIRAPLFTAEVGEQAEAA